ncbi:hypothetical protein BCR35DRAFT_353594, partial [Leucosporidium creatinivorum]
VRTSALFFLLFTRSISARSQAAQLSPFALSSPSSRLGASTASSPSPTGPGTSAGLASRTTQVLNEQQRQFTPHPRPSRQPASVVVEPWLSSLLRRRSPARRLLSTSLKRSRCSPAALPLPLRLKPSLRSESLLLRAGVASDARRCGSVK